MTPGDILRPIRFAGFVTLVAGLACSQPVDADVLRLKNGGELRGRVVTAVTRTPGERIVVETLCGALVEVDGDTVAFIARRSLVVEEYETRARRAEDTVAGQWELAEWGRTHRLIRQRDRHLRRVVELEPDHQKAHRALKHTLRDGRWMSREEYMESRGLVRYRGRYVTPQEKEILEQREIAGGREAAWFRKVRIWHGWLTGRDADRRARAEGDLLQVNSPDAIRSLRKFLGGDPNTSVRLLYVRVLGGIAGRPPVAPLVHAALRDEKYVVRSLAIESIGAERQAVAVPLFIGGLRDRSNKVVRRSATALGKSGDRRAVAPLIAALSTAHLFRVRVPGSRHPSYGFGADGTPLNQAARYGLPPEVIQGLQAGRFPYGVIILPPQFANLETHLITVRVIRRNPEVLGALVELTGENLAYDERGWHLWWLAHADDPPPSSSDPGS